MKSILLIATITVATAFSVVNTATAQVAGSSTTFDVAVTESTKNASGWSVKRTILDKPVYDSKHKKIGKVKDLIISPDRNVSYVIISAGGFVGLGKHDVAIPIVQVENQSGELVILDATKESIKALPHFEYSHSSLDRDKFIAETDKELANGRESIASMKAKAASASDEAAKVMRKNIQSAESSFDVLDNKVSEMKRASANQWKKFEAGIRTATVDLRKALSNSPA